MYTAVISLQNLITRLLRQDESGATAVEYALILVFIAVIIAAAVKVLGHTIQQAFAVAVNKF
jgi:Flp pilus assembly pilin Flp